MTALSELIPNDTAFTMTVDSDRSQGDGAEAWIAELVATELDDDLGGVLRGVTLAWARIYRAHFSDANWYDNLDSESSSVEIVAAAFVAREEQLDELDENLVFAPGLLVVDYIEVAPHARGAKLSHALLRAVSSVFREEHIGLVPASVSIGEDDALHQDPVKAAALRQHWGAFGFEAIPDSSVMWLPSSARQSG